MNNDLKNIWMKNENYILKKLRICSTKTAYDSITFSKSCIDNFENLIEKFSILTKNRIFCTDYKENNKDF